MKVQKHAISLACLAAVGFAGSAHAVQVAEGLEVIGNLYPQYQQTNFGAGSGVSNSTLVTAASATAPVDKTQINWVNSYIGFKGQKSFGDVSAGFELQGVTQAAGTSTTNTFTSDARDAYLFVSHKAMGTLQIGQMDTAYKEFGDRVRMLGVSSSNIVSTSSVLSGVTFTSTGTTSFNTRINGQLRWISPNWNGIEVGITQRPDPARTATNDASLQAYAIRWSNAMHYVGLATEIHNDYRISQGGPATIANAAGTKSKDTGTRITYGYTSEKIRLGADIAQLNYTEDGTNNKFESYKTSTWQVSGEYKLNPQVTLAANYASNAEGTCSLVGGAACSTSGLGGTLLSLGSRYDFDKNIGIFALVASNNVGNSGKLASGAVGGSVTNVAVGVQVKF